jgi:transposase
VIHGGSTLPCGTFVQFTSVPGELWIGDAAQIAARRVRKQKTDRQDAQFLLKLLLEDRFPRV